MTGTILKGIGGFYYVLAGDGVTYTLRAQSKIRHEKLSPVVGDRVEFEPGSGADEEGWLKAILPRRNALIRPAVANIDKLVITMSASVPVADRMLCDRLLIYARENSISAVIAINKCDTDTETAAQLKEEYSQCGAEVYCISAKTGEGVAELKACLSGTVHAFAGQSAVGKSSLANALYSLELDTGGLSAKIDRGRHTTRRCELIPVEGGGMVLDTPGFSLLESNLTEPCRLQELYPEFKPFEGKCRFSPCYHVSEPDCAVLEALEEGGIPRGRYSRYKELLAEMKERWNRRYD